MPQIDTLTINNNQYYKADDVYSINPAFFYGCASNPRNIVTKKNLSADLYIYVKQKDNNWELSDKSYCRAKLLLSKLWVDANVKGIADSNDTKDIKNDVEMGPPEIILNDDEYFTGCDSTKLKIKIRGNREKKEFYFSVQDVAKAFELPQLNKTIIDNRNDGYQKDIHYKYFTFTKVGSTNSQESKNKFMYLTYKGLIRCLYVSKSKNADKFQDWATNILFTHQFGSEADKTNLASKLLGVHVDAVKEVFKTSTTPIPCVYLFTLGTVKNLRKSMKLDNKFTDNMIVCKYGKTDSLVRRTGEHISTYGSIKGCQLMLRFYSYIDPKNITEAENYIKDQMNAINAHITYENHKELIVLDPKVLNDKINTHFTMMAKAFAGCIAELQAKIKDLENQLLIEKERHKNEMLQNKYVVLEKDREIDELKSKHEIELLKKELEWIKKGNK
ncbi:BRO N-terminal domain-containing protein [Fadolivirus algeromassiliense]|jgi:hypothetical protein|uniref:BRO N-terminal domain-containing protein n=1 Tax=Fadolivirus FV1/VV64 TaxID=3070911 RepID=A0A7D3QVC2_9VIRU|nr:BRO N-terminal domain-containing protein [Fadolivirus algeromassiliense]QKF94783.1 BRO N-terminal domain-containing protein [Fadolivirus FV1/VV64]